MEPSKNSDKADDDERERAAEDVRRLGMRAWARALLNAQGVRAEEMGRAVAGGGRFRNISSEDIRGSEGEEKAIEIVRWLALLFMDGRAPLAEETETLRRMISATRFRGNAPSRGPITDQTIVRALEIVERHAQRFIELPSDWTLPPDTLSWSPRQEAANALAVDLFANVHEGFDCIVPESSAIRTGTLPAESGPRDIALLDKIADSLERYEPDRGREPSAARDETKLSGARILEQLNALAASPLGKDLDAQAITNAVNRLR